jgi:O-antigen ligase
VLNPDWKKFLLTATVVPLALAIGTLIARGEWIWPCLALGLAIAVIAGGAVRSSFSALVLAVLMFGYIAGNRGFAQLSLSGNLPLFPAEIGLAVTLPLLIWHSSRTRQLPWQHNEINFALMAWIAIGCVRILWDVRAHGAAALRDFAMVYYAFFFFVAQRATGADNGAKWFQRVLLTASAVMLPLYVLFQNFPEFFISTLTVRGSPLIFFKGDLAGTFLSIGSLAWFFHYEKRTGRWWSLMLSLAMAGSMVATNNRASMLALAIPTTLLALSGRTRLLKVFMVAGIVTALAVALWTQLSGRPWRDSPLVGVYERIVSIVDFEGARNYQSTSAEPKGDNNRFRTVWWSTVITETTQANPWTGLGFGHDLADNFLKAYYPDSDEQFTARSPHNFFITVYARTGLIGLVAFVSLIVLAATHARRAFRRGTPAENLLAWCVATALLTSACFGVVLEGPMGAVVFWISLGVAAGTLISESSPQAATAPAKSEPSAEPSIVPFSGR